ncbi:MAG: serine hydrolase domain-containing protein [Gammaproteobacteria bacterium]
MSVRRLAGGLGLLIVLLLTYLLWPVYGFIGEDTPWMRKPWAWQAVPAADDCQSGVVQPAMAQLAEQACSLLKTRQAAIHAPSLSAAVAMDGELVWSAAVGWADLASDKLATPQTLYRIGSTSKPVTGTLLAQMVANHSVDLDTPIGNYELALPNPDWAQLTLRQLASHMAGMPEYSTNKDWVGLYQTGALRRHHTNITESLELFDGSPLRYQPGTKFEYSSFDTLIIAAVLQSAGKQPFTELIRQQVTAPLGLSSPMPDADNSQRATFYQLDEDRVQPWRKVDLSNKLPGGGFMSRPADLAMLGSAWLNNEFIDEATRDTFWTPQTLNNGEVNEQSYALTWRWHEAGHYAHHGGVSKGSMAWLAVYPERSLVIAMTMNTTLPEFTDFSSLQTELVALFSQVKVQTTL